MKRDLNNKGFTLIEVLAVIVILAIIMAIALPNITASLDRQGCKTVEARAELIESSAQFYVSDHRNIIKTNLDSNTSCKITLDKMQPNYITSDDLQDGNGGTINGYVIYNQNEETYTFCITDTKGCSDLTACSTVTLPDDCVTS